MVVLRCFARRAPGAVRPMIDSVQVVPEPGFEVPWSHAPLPPDFLQALEALKIKA